MVYQNIAILYSLVKAYSITDCKENEINFPWNIQDGLFSVFFEDFRVVVIVVLWFIVPDEFLLQIWLHC